MSSALCEPSDPVIEETFALAAHLVDYAVYLVEQVLPGHVAAQRLREGIHTLDTELGFRCEGCGQIRPAEEFNRFRIRGAERQQPCAACCRARAQDRLGVDAKGSR